MIRMKIIVFACLLGMTIWGRADAQERDYLVSKFGKAELERSLQPAAQWVRFPSYADREAWAKLVAPVGEQQVIAGGDRFLDYTWQVVKATDYLAYERTGSRVIMEKPMGENTMALSHLFLAELAEGKGRFLDQIINGVWYFTEMSTWSLSAHVPAYQSSKRSLPQADTHVFDLMAGDLGSLLSWIYFFLKPEMDQVNPEISKRLKTHIHERIIQPYMERNDFWWQAFELKPGQLVNNWNPWCNFNALTCLLLVEDQQETRVAGIYKTMRSVDQFINYVKSDGACEEGPSYWGHAAGKLYDYLQLLSYATGGEVTLFEQPMIRAMGEYIAQSYIGGDHWVVNFADASARGGGDPYLIYRYGKAVGSQEMKQFAKYLADERKASFTVARDVFRSLEDLNTIPQLAQETPALPTDPYTWYPETEFLYLRQAGAFFAAKGGYNNESHNHNDIGSFILYRDSEPVFIDAGVGTYNKKTFSSERYDIWTMQSGYHNLPQINGADQQFGSAYRSRNVHFTPKRNQFVLDIAGAYPAAAGVSHWNRGYRLTNGKLTITDEFAIEHPAKPNIVHFLLAEKPEIQSGEILLNAGKYRLVYDAKLFDASVEALAQDDPRLSNVWGDSIYRIALTAKKTVNKGTYVFTVY